MPAESPTPTAPNAAVQLLVDELGVESTRELVEIYLKEFTKLRDQLASGDRQRQRFAAHSLKSSSHHMGAVALSEMMARYEERLEQPAGTALTAEEVAAADREFEIGAAPLRVFLGA
jgi:HPt (histidine-containing phosphotransfer) domain-containing protein